MRDLRKIKKYANTLIRISNKSNQDPKDIIENLLSFKNLLRELPELRYLLLSKRISLTNKLVAIKNIFENYYGQLEIEFISILLENGEMGMYNDIIEKLVFTFESMDNFKKLNIVLSKEYDSDEKNEITNLIRDKFNITNSSEASFSIDKNILGGIKIRIGNKIIDGSISTKLNKIKRALTSI